MSALGSRGRGFGCRGGSGSRCFEGCGRLLDVKDAQLPAHPVTDMDLVLHTRIKPMIRGGVNKTVDGLVADGSAVSVNDLDGLHGRMSLSDLLEIVQ